MKQRSTRWMLAAMLVHAACGGNPFVHVPGKPASVARIEIDLLSEPLTVGKTVQARASLLDASGNLLEGRAVNWSSSDLSVATVDWSGVIAGVAVGSATVTAVSEDRTGFVQLTVRPVPVGAIVVTLSSGTIHIGQSTQATAVVRDASENILAGRSVNWASSDPSVAMVDGSGLVAAVSVGSAVITGTSEGQSGSAVLAVSPIPAAGVEVTLSSAAAFVGQTVLASATVRAAGGTVLGDRAVTWWSSDPSVAAVDGSGQVTVLAEGTALVSATCEGITGWAALTATMVPVAAVEVTLSSGSVTVGQTTQATATVRDANGNVLTSRTVTWSSSNTAVATVDGNGLMTTLTPGSVSLTASCEGRSGSAALVVNPVPVATAGVALSATSVIAGQTAQATATVRDANGNVLTGRAVSWVSSNGAVATVDGNGLVTTLTPGSVSLTASCEGRSGSATLVVNPIPVATVGAALPVASVIAGQTAQATEIYTQ